MSVLLLSNVQLLDQLQTLEPGVLLRGTILTDGSQIDDIPFVGKLTSHVNYKRATLNIGSELPMMTVLTVLTVLALPKKSYIILGKTDTDKHFKTVLQRLSLREEEVSKMEDVLETCRNLLVENEKLKEERKLMSVDTNNHHMSEEVLKSVMAEKDAILNENISLRSKLDAAENYNHDLNTELLLIKGISSHKDIQIVEEMEKQLNRKSEEILQVELEKNRLLNKVRDLEMKPALGKELSERLLQQLSYQEKLVRQILDKHPHHLQAYNESNNILLLIMSNLMSK